MEENLIVKLSLDFAIDIVEYAELLDVNKKYVIARQLLKSGTSIGANIREAQNAESPLDFLHKLKIAAKEVEETDYWLLLCSYSKSYPDCGHLRTELVSIRNILNKIIITCKSKK